MVPLAKVSNRETQYVDYSKELKNQVKPHSIPKLENRFRSGGIGKSETVNIHLYPNRWVLVNQIEESVRW
jgi:hypothetical protein